MNKLLNVYPECFIDTYLVMYLLKADRVNHQHSCNKVTGSMKTGTFSIGIVDYDKAKKAIYNRYWTPLISGTEEKLNLVFFKHHTEPHYLIAINPAMESFVLNCAKEMNIDSSLFGLPSSLDDFRRLTKNRKTTPNDTRFKRFFSSIQNHPSISTLRDVLQYLSYHEYSSVDGEIIDIIDNGMTSI